MSLIVYGLDNCDTCRKARNWLDRRQIEFRFVDYRAQPIPAPLLKQWALALGGWEKLVNRASTTWRNLPAARKTPGSAAEWTLLIREYPSLIRRPLLHFEDDRVQQGFSDKLFKSLFA